MEKRFSVERMETNLVIKNTLESSLKSFTRIVIYNMNLIMQQRLPPSIQHQFAPPPPLTIVVQPHLEVLASKATIPNDLVPMPSLLQPNSPPPNLSNSVH